VYNYVEEMISHVLHFKYIFNVLNKGLAVAELSRNMWPVLFCIVRCVRLLCSIYIYISVMMMWVVVELGY
jgi:hypothetical protein